MPSTGKRGIVLVSLVLSNPMSSSLVFGDEHNSKI